MQVAINVSLLLSFLAYTDVITETLLLNQPQECQEPSAECAINGIKEQKLEALSLQEIFDTYDTWAP